MDLPHSDRLKLKTITTADIHARDIVDSFVENNIMDARNFQWMTQLRFHWLKDLDNLYVEHYSGMPNQTQTERKTNRKKEKTTDY